MAEYFDKIAHRYDEWYKTKVGGYVDKTEKKLVFSMIKTKHGNALDLGCGTGKTIHWNSIKGDSRLLGWT